jgi:microcystin-dependent protein
MLNTIANSLMAEFPQNFTKLNFGPDTPGVNDQAYPWFRQGGADPGKPDGLYYYVGGKWVMQHPVPAGAGERRFWFGESGALQTYDGGAAGTVTATTGPMWEIDANMQGRFPIGRESGKAWDLNGEKGGAETVTLTVAQLPAHTHTYQDTIWRESQSCRIGDYVLDTDPAGDGNQGIDGNNSTWVKDRATKSTGSGSAVSIMPPWIAGYWIKRTARKYYVAS